MTDPNQNGPTDEGESESEKASSDGGGVEAVECFSCGATDNLEAVGGIHICPDCAGSEDDSDEEDATYSLWGEELDFGDVFGDRIPDALACRDQWMVHKGDKKPYAPWTDADAPVECGKDGHETADQCGCDARYKWGDESNYRPLDDAQMVLDDPRFDGLTFLQQTTDPIAHIDFDDVRDPETKRIHPGVIEILEKTGPTFVQVSTSGTGIHAIYTGELPDDLLQSSWTLSPDPFVGEDLPSAEFYHRRRVIAVTGRHVPGTPTEVNEWDQNAVKELIEENDDSAYTSPEDATTGDGASFHPGEREEADFDISDYDPDATSGDETTSNFTDIKYALRRLDAQRVADRTIVREWNDSASTSSEYRAFDPTWGPDGNGTANIVSKDGWADTGDVGDSGDVIHMAAIDLGIISPDQAYKTVTGDDFWECVEHLRDLGFDIPEYEPPETSGEYTAVLPEAAGKLGDGELRRYAKKRGIEWPTADELYDELKEELVEAVGSNDYVVLNAPTGVGKTHCSSRMHWNQMKEETDGKPVVIFHSTTDARDEAYQMSKDEGLEAKRLLGRMETCPLAQGEQDPHNPEGHPELRMDGKPVSEWIAYRAEKLGIPYSVLHREIEEKHGDSLVCEEGDTGCQSKSIFEDVPRDEDGNTTYDVIHATKPFAHVPSMRMQTHMIFDEKPDYGLGLYQDGEMKSIFKRSVEAYLNWLDIPIDSYHDLVNASKDGVMPGVQKTIGDGVGYRTPIDSERATERLVETADENSILQAADWDMVVNYARGKDEDTDEYDAHEIADLVGELTSYQKSMAVDPHQLISEALKKSPPLGWFKNNRGIHANANAFARAVWEAEERAAGRYAARVSHEPPRLDAHAHDADGWNKEEVRIVFNASFEPLQGWSVPDTTLAASVVGLDAHAQHEDPLWQANLMPGIRTEKLVTGEERARYRRYERGLHVVKVGEATHPVTGGKYIDGGQGRSFRAMVERLRHEHGDDFRSAISSKDAVEHIEGCLLDAGCDDPKTMYYGIEESNNDFAGEKVGYVAGSIDPGDNPIMNTVAGLGLDAAPATSECGHCEGSGKCHGDCSRDDCGIEAPTCGVCDGSGQTRAHGRGFAGKDAGAADRVLKGVREHHVHQSVGRYARDARDPESQAVVYVQTDAIAEHMYDVEVPGPVWTATENQRDVLEALEQSDVSKTTQELADEAGCTREAARQVLNHERVSEAVVKHPGEGRYGSDLWEPTPRLSTSGEVDIDGASPPDLQGVRTDTHTWSLEIRSALTRGGILEAGDETERTVQYPLGYAEAMGPPPE